ncbi:hypothetical protein ACFW04_011883 [Cataglyphis niger]
MLGDKRFDVDTDDSILINGIRYVGTPGLYELIFKRMPDDLVYTENDKLTYRNILLTTNAHRRDKKANNPILGNKGYKYRHVIAPLLHFVGKRLDIAESSLSRRLDVAESSILSINNTIKFTLLGTPPHALPRREKTEESKESEKPNEKSRIAANSAEKIKKLEELASRLTKESNELEKRIQDLEKTASPFSNKASPNLPVLIQAPSMSDEKGKRP